MRIQCDRCGTIYSVEYHETIPYQTEDDMTWYMFSVVRFDGTILVGQNSSDIHLCPECSYKLRRWVDDYDSTDN